MKHLRRAKARLDIRVAAYDAVPANKKGAYKRPGSMSKRKSCSTKR